ncbi:MAG: helix-turn-helix transcriptional regulator [Stigonema ocellatum SAG 48.90 = DSM 106950]|nr:helix-turn-helix transcriptional regulator [Stigonema ocellatum SAG 48.90 = DSM 106950]
MQPDMKSPISSITEPNQTCNFGAVSEFHLNNFHFLVIPLDQLTDSETTSASDRVPTEKDFSVLGHFEFNGYPYAVIHTPNPSKTIDSTLMSCLTGRELQVAALIALGWPNKQVAKQLRISEWTVSAHLRRIFTKLNVDSRAAMVYRCASLINGLHQLGIF